MYYNKRGMGNVGESLNELMIEDLKEKQSWDLDKKIEYAKEKEIGRAHV